MKSIIWKQCTSCVQSYPHTYMHEFHKDMCKTCVNKAIEAYKNKPEKSRRLKK